MVRNKDTIIFFSITLILLILFGCNSTQEDTLSSQNPGELGLKINWETNGFDETTNQADSFDCVSSGVKDIEIIVYDQSGNELTSSDLWDCDKHKGAIKGISEGTINILLLGRDEDGKILYRGMESGVTVIPGKSQKVNITAYQFVPELIFPEAKSCATHPTLSWQEVKGAESYSVHISENENMDPYISSGRIKDSYFEFKDKKENTIYYWRVYSQDAQNNFSEYSDINSFSTTSKTILKDIDKGSPGSDPEDFTVINNNIFFQAYNTLNGESPRNGLWFSNRTSVVSGTILLKDIGGTIFNLVELNGELLFSIEESNGSQLWKSDGTIQGTTMLNIDFLGSRINYRDFSQEYKKHVYFSMSDGVKRQLWRTDGTEKGTILFKDMQVDNFFVANFTLQNQKTPFLFFSGNDGLGDNHELWRTDGTLNGTIMVKDLNPNGGSYPSEWIFLKNTLFFAAIDSTNKYVIWKSDGTEKNTTIVKDGYPYNLTAVGDIFYFVGENHSDLWKSNGTTEGTVLVKTFQGSIHEMTSFLGQLFFSADHKEYGTELWVSDGTSNGTRLFKDINNGPDDSNPSCFLPIGNTLYFTAYDHIHGDELWKSDGTPENTKILLDIFPGKEDSYIMNLEKIGSLDSFIFSANDGKSGQEPWICEANGATIKRLKDINKIKTERPPKNLTTLNDTLFFASSDTHDGFELWKSNGQAVGTQKVKNINPVGGSFPENLTVLNNTVYFTAGHEGYTDSIWKSGGNEKDTILVHSFNREVDIYELIPHNNSIFFTTNDYIDGWELWVSDGTNKINGTHSITIAPGTTGSYPDEITPIGDNLYFTADDNTNGRELWITKGDAEKTYSAYKFLNQNTVNLLASLANHTLFFTDGENSKEGLWAFDTKSETAKFIHSISGISQLESTGNRLFINASSDTNGSSIWISDGSSKGTKELIPANKQDPISSIFSLTSSDNGYYFVTKHITGEYRKDLWFTDRNTEKAHIVRKNIDPNGLCVEKKIMIAINDRLFFNGYDPDHGQELWQTDGSKTNTSLVWDIYPGPESGNPTEFAVMNDTIYFSGCNKETGCEIRAICSDIVDY